MVSRAAVRPTATERFITEYVEPRREQLRTWTGTLAHDVLLQRAAHRKSMTVKQISDSNRVFFLSDVVVGGMDAVITSLVSHQARRISRSKQMTKRYLEASEVPTPKGKAINTTQFSRAVKYMKALGRPVAIKPSSGRTGKGITTNVTAETELRQAWAKAMAARSVTSDSRDQMMVEVHHPGLDVRVFVVGQKVAGAVARVPFYIVGDGLTTVGGLADAEIERRGAEGYLAARQPQVTDEFLDPVGLTRASVVGEGELQLLTPIADTARGGGLAVEITDQLSDDLQDLAVDGLWSIPGLNAAAVDLLVSDLDSAEGAVVLEVNPYANITEFHYPAYGESRPVADAIMEQILERASR